MFSNPLPSGTMTVAGVRLKLAAIFGCFTETGCGMIFISCPTTIHAEKKKKANKETERNLETEVEKIIKQQAQRYNMIIK